MRTIWIVLGILLTAAGTGQGPADNSPSLEVTTKFIQDKVNAVGPLNYSISFHNTADGKDWVNRFNDEITRVAANPESCRVDYHERFVVDGNLRFDSDYSFDLKQVDTVLVLTVEEDLARHGGQPTWQRKSDRPLWSLWVGSGNNRASSIYFADEDTASLVAKAVRHAADLCGANKY